MCGIAGYWLKRSDQKEQEALLREMCSAERHRGPDDITVTTRDQVGMGFVRLSILDLETGMQPITCPDDNTAIACNGQIYNYIELKSQLPSYRYRTTGDMEVALNAYRHYGPGFPKYLNGMFAGVIHDPGQHRVILFRDRFGIKPLYYAEVDQGIYFASEIKPLLRVSGIQCEMDKTLLPTFFRYRYIPGEKTLFKGIRKLSPGTCLIIDTRTGITSFLRYWEWRFSHDSRKMPVEEAIEEFHRLFTDSVRIRLRSDVEVGSLISGGIDSSAVASAAAVLKPDLKLFTIGFTEEKYDETSEVDSFLRQMPERFSKSVPVRRICSRKQLELLPGIIRAVEEPISLGTMVPTDQVCSLAAEQLKVVLTGEGADEIFAGYRKFLVEAAALAYPDANTSEKHRLTALYPELHLRKGNTDEDHIRRHIASEMLFSDSELCDLLGTDKAVEFDFRNSLPQQALGSVHPVTAMQLIESATRMPHYVNLRLDKISMRHSLETRTPFLDYRLAEFAGTLPLSLRVNLNRGLEKYICRRSLAARGILPESVALRPKKPFTMPIADWFADPDTLTEEIREILLGDAVDRQGILDGKLVRKYAGLVTGRDVGPETMLSAGDRVFAIVVFSLWYKEFMEGDQ